LGKRILDQFFIISGGTFFGGEPSLSLKKSSIKFPSKILPGGCTSVLKLSILLGNLIPFIELEKTLRK